MASISDDNNGDGAAERVRAKKRRKLSWKDKIDGCEDVEECEALRTKLEGLVRRAKRKISSLKAQAKREGLSYRGADAAACSGNTDKRCGSTFKVGGGYGGQCPACDKPLCVECLQKCKDCEEFRCADCAEECHYCEGVLCVGCGTYCETCGERVHHMCIHDDEGVCKQCLENFCEHCAEHWEG